MGEGGAVAFDVKEVEESVGAREGAPRQQG